MPRHSQLRAADRATVVVIGPSAEDSFADNIAAGFRAAGVTAVVVDPFAGFTGQGNLRAYSRYGTVMREAIARSELAQEVLLNRPLGRQLESYEPLLVVCVYALLRPQQVERFRSLTPGARWVLWYPDAISNLGAHSCMLAPYDHLFFKEPFLVDLLLSRTSLPVSYLPEACDPARHRSVEPTSEAERRRYACDVAVAGNIYPYRLLVLKGVPDDVELKIYGNSRVKAPAAFQRVRAAQTGTFVSGRTKALAFRGAKVVLNTIHYAELEGVNARLFEATGCGGFVLSHASRGLNRYFEPDREVVTFESTAELSERIRHYLWRPDEREAIAAAGQARAHRDHTYGVRLKELTRLAGLSDHRDMGTFALCGD